MKTYEFSLPNITYVSYSSLNRLILFWAKLKSIKDSTIYINCTNVQELDISLFSVLGILLEDIKNTNNNTILFRRIPKLLFSRFIDYEFVKIKSMKNKCIPHDLELNVLNYKTLSGDDNDLFRSYINENISKLNLSKNTSDMLIKVLMEIFLNVQMHARTHPEKNVFKDKEIFFAGYYDKNSDILKFTICNRGISFKDNVKSKLGLLLKSDHEYISLVLTKGMSSKKTIPGGMGLYFLHNLIKNSNGYLSICSGKGLYSIESNKPTIAFDNQYEFPGSLISASFKVNALSNILIDDISPTMIFTLNDIISTEGGI